MDEVKKSIWEFDVNRMSALKISFAQPLTRAEAIAAFNDEGFEDIIDEEDHGIEVVGSR